MQARAKKRPRHTAAARRTESLQQMGLCAAREPQAVAADVEVGILIRADPKFPAHGLRFRSI